MKNAFYFMLKALFTLEILTFLSWFLFMKENGLIRKLSLISMFMTFMTGQQVITIHMLSKITKSKGNQAMKFGQLIEGKMICIYFLKTHTKSVVEKLVTDSFINGQNWEHLWISCLKYYKAFFLLYVQVLGCQNILKLRCWLLVLALYIAFLKNRRISGTRFPASLFAWILKKNTFRNIFH